MPLRERLRVAIRQEGLGGTLERVRSSAWRSVSFSEDHVWLALDLTAEWPRPPLAAELRLARQREPDRQLLEQVPEIAPSESRARIEAGNDLWAVLEGDRLLFSCWTFHGHAPAVAAAGGQLVLAADTACLEDSVAAPAARGRGIAPATWGAVAEAVAREGKLWIITKVTVENASSLRAVEKAGFEAVALMHFRRRGPRSRTWLEGLGAPRTDFFLERLRTALGIDRDSGALTASIGRLRPR